MKITIHNTKTAINGHEYETELMTCPDTKKMRFLADFQSRCADTLEFDSIKELLDYLDANNKGLNHVISYKDIYQIDIINGSRELMYFGKMNIEYDSTKSFNSEDVPF